MSETLQGPIRWAFLTRPVVARAIGAGSRVSAPAIRLRQRCQLHGGTSTRARTAEGLERIRQAVTKHGFYSATAKEQRRRARQLHGNCARCLLNMTRFLAASDVRRLRLVCPISTREFERLSRTTWVGEVNGPLRRRTERGVQRFNDGAAVAPFSRLPSP